MECVYCNVNLDTVGSAIVRGDLSLTINESKSDYFFVLRFLVFGMLMIKLSSVATV